MAFQRLHFTTAGILVCINESNVIVGMGEIGRGDKGEDNIALERGERG